MQQMRAESLPLHHAIEDALRDARCSMVSPLVAQQRVWGMCEDELAGVVGCLPLPMLASCSLRVLQRQLQSIAIQILEISIWIQSGFNLDSIWIQSGFNLDSKRHTFPLSFPSQLFK
jgi:hypothetical protein